MIFCLIRFFIVILANLSFTAVQSIAQIPLYEVYEVSFAGPDYTVETNPVRDVILTTEWRHEDGQLRYLIHGFWDGDGKGDAEGNVFKVRFCPTKTGKWTLVNTYSNIKELNGQKAGLSVLCVDSDCKGFWEVDNDNAGGRWYKRSDGSHQYVVGNTMYSFLSEMDQNGPNGSDIATDVRGNAQYFKKIRFSICGDRYPHPSEKPFLDHDGRPTDDGDFSFRPNPAWFHKRVDLAVQTAFENDMIADLILNGPDTEDSRSVLVAAENGGDPEPILRYIAARYGSYPNVWICLANEWDIKKPKFNAAQINRYGHMLKPFLPYPIPVSIHAAPTDWNPDLNCIIPWNDHIILQYKIKNLHTTADFIEKNYWIGEHNKPVIDDELAYEGQGDQWTENDVIEAHLGAFMGGGYGSTGHKPASKQGHYFTGAFKASEHTSADNLSWMRKKIDENITFWKLSPVVHPRFNRNKFSLGPFVNIHEHFRALVWKNNEYVLATNKKWDDILIWLPKGMWQIKQYDIIRKRETIISSHAEGRTTIQAPDSRACMFHFKKIKKNNRK